MDRLEKKSKVKVKETRAKLAGINAEIRGKIWKAWVACISTGSVAGRNMGSELMTLAGSGTKVVKSSMQTHVIQQPCLTFCG